MRDPSGSILTNPFPQFLYYAAVFFIPFYRWRHLVPEYPFLSVDWLLIIVLLITLIPYYLLKKAFPRELSSNLAPWYLLFLVANLISLCLSSYPSAALSGIRLLIMAYMFIALSQMLISLEGFRKILPLVLSWSVAVCSLLAILGYSFELEIFTYGTDVGGIKRGVGATIGANNLSLMCIFVIPLLIHWVFYGQSDISRAIAIILLLVNLSGLVSTFSRGGFLNLIVMTIILALEHRVRFSPRHMGIVLTLIGMVFILGTLAVPQAFYERQKTILKGEQPDASIDRRAAYLRVGWESFVKHPFLGSGTNTFKEIWAESSTALHFLQKKRYAHNTYIEVLTGSGMLGLLIFLCILFQALRNFSKAKKTFQEIGNAEMTSLIGAYRASFISLVIYLFMLSGVTHKFFLLSLALSHISFTLSQEQKDRRNNEYVSNN